MSQLTSVKQTIYQSWYDSLGIHGSPIHYRNCTPVHTRVPTNTFPTYILNPFNSSIRVKQQSLSYTIYTQHSLDDWSTVPSPNHTNGIVAILDTLYINAQYVLLAYVCVGVCHVVGIGNNPPPLPPPGLLYFLLFFCQNLKEPRPNRETTPE